MGHRLTTDRHLFFTALAMSGLGLIMVYSASSVMAELRYRNGWYFFGRQALWLALGLIFMMIFKRLHYRKLKDSTVAYSAIGISLMLLGIVFFADPAHHRWIRFAGFSIQPSEFAKPALVMFLAFFVTHRSEAINNSRFTLLPASLAVGLLLVVVAKGDFGTAAVLTITVATIFWVAGLERRYVIIAGAVAAAGMVYLIAEKPYRIARIVGFADPEFKVIAKFDKDGKFRDYLKRSLVSRDTSYQSEQSVIAVGAGGPLGQGLMNGKQKLLYLPEAHTDMIYAVVSEELGLFGSLGTFTGFVIVLWRGLRATVRAPDEFGRYVALGVTTLIVVQAFINISVALGMGPVKGMPLPMISFGGSSLLSTMALMGMLMNVSEHAG